MLRSMTGYGRASLTTAQGRFVVEVQSVNRDHLDIQIFAPKELARFDHELRKLVAASIARGHITVRVTAQFENGSPVSVRPNIPLAEQITNACRKISNELGIVLQDDALWRLLTREDGVLQYEVALEGEEGYRTSLREAASQALKAFVTMREVEGQTLQRDICQRFKLLRQTMNQIASKAPQATEGYRKKLTERLNEVISGCVENEERVLREVCLFAERVDIAEEVTRFNSHLDQVESLLRSDQSAIGKTLKFMLQELGREINTIGSKSSDSEVSHLVVEVKGELERVREQALNIE
ncbi:MAG: YicC family protein [Parachlamydiaceae bacterium]|nr:YicC family protein [Parachlamydiaceae bacterium]